jgi:hypothetical protein
MGRLSEGPQRRIKEKQKGKIVCFEGCAGIKVSERISLRRVDLINFRKYLIIRNKNDWVVINS